MSSTHASCSLNQKAACQPVMTPSTHAAGSLLLCKPGLGWQAGCGLAAKCVRMSVAFRTDLQQICSCLLGCLPHSLCRRVLEQTGRHLPLVAIIIVNPGVPVQPRLQQRQADSESSHIRLHSGRLPQCGYPWPAQPGRAAVAGTFLKRMLVKQRPKVWALDAAASLLAEKCFSESRALACKL